MSSRRKLALVGIMAAFVLGVAALLAPTPSEAAGNCPRSCPPIKKHNGFPCKFVGCDPVTNACLYGC